MKFLAPHWLWGLAVLPALYALLLWDEWRKRKQFERFAEKSLWTLITPEMNPTARLRKGGVLLLALGFALLALARPQFGSHEEVVQASGLDIVFALDVSNSMDAEDVAPSRLKKAKHLIRTIVEGLSGDRVGVAVFAANSHVACPLTTDLKYFLDTVQILSPRMAQNQGTDIGVGIETAYRCLDRGAEENPNAQNAGVPTRALILISDGEDHEGTASSLVAKLKESGIRLYVFGVGTEKGGPIPLKDDNGNVVGFKKDPTGQAVVTTFKGDFLKNLAEEAGGKYWDVTPDEGEAAQLLQDMGTLGRNDYAERRYLVYEDRYQIPLVIAVILLFLEISLPTRKLLTVLTLLGLGSVFSTPVLAESKSPKPSLETYLQNQKGVRAYQEGKIEEAEQNFGSAQARDPSRPELEFNQGVIQLEKGEAEKAIQAFENSAKSASGSKDLGLEGKSYYNLGNALAKKSDPKGAAEAYLRAIAAAQQAKDTKLEDEARKNLQLLVMEEEKKKQEEQQSKESEQGGKKEQEQDGSDSKKQKESSEKEPKQYQKPKKQQKFQSKKMSPEDADRVMSELTSRERALQEKLQTQNAKQTYHSRDW